MPVIFCRNQALELNRVEYRGAIALDELKAFAKFQADKPDFLGADCLNVVHPNADFSGISVDMMTSLFAYYRQLFTPLRLQIFRRAVWLCEGDAPAQITFWLSQDTKEGMFSTVKQCRTFADAADWLLLMDAERGALERGEGFEEIMRFDLSAAPTRAIAR